MASEALIWPALEDNLRRSASHLRDLDLASRKAEEAGRRRQEATAWLRKTVGTVGGKDLTENPSEEEFTLGLRNGLILCNAFNKVQPGAVPKVVSSLRDSDVSDETALSAYQYFENIRNFHVAAEDIGLPNFEATDLEKGGNSAKVVDCVLALKSYSEWKTAGGSGSWKFGGNTKHNKFFGMKNSGPCPSSPPRHVPNNKSSNEISSHDDINEMNIHLSFDILVHSILAGKPHEITAAKAAIKDMADGKKSSLKRRVLAELATIPGYKKEYGDENMKYTKGDLFGANLTKKEELKDKLDLSFQRQEKGIQELKHSLYSTRSDMKLLQMKYSEDLCNLGEHLQSLARAASGYHKVLAENKSLYNQVQELKGNIRVYCRVRPFLAGQSYHMSSIGQINDGHITINTSTKYGKGGHKSFNFNKVFDASATQDEIFSDTQPLIRSVLDGYNVCIFAYGQTGSGKTYTMTGPKDITKTNQGVNYRALNDLFYIVEQRREIFSYDISVQMIEIYNEQVRDLLSNDGFNKRLEIHTNSQNGINVPEANLVPVASTSDIIELMDIGQKNRAVGSTAMNNRSSRSHSCLTVRVQGKEIESGTILRGCMHLIDLAGSERVEKSEATGERLKEAQHINKSLSALGDVIAALAQKNSHVPYRNSKLTQLLQDSLGGQAKTLIFVHISPEVDTTEETISTLKFAERVSSVELGAAKINKESSKVKELKDEIARLKDALARKHVQKEHYPEMSNPMSSRKHSSRSHGRITSIGHVSDRQQEEDLRKVVTCDSSVRQSKIIDPVELSIGKDSPPWSENNGKGTEKETSSRDWSGNSQDDETPDFLHQGCFSGKRVQSEYRKQFTKDDGSVISVKDSQVFDVQSIQYESSIVDDLDELEIATSISSETDALFPYNHSHATRASGKGSKLRKPQPNLSKYSEIRTPVRGCGPSPSPSKKPSHKFSKTPNRLQHSSNGKMAVVK